MYKILSVDDEPINQAIVEELFSEKFNVELVSSGEECMLNIASIKPDLILLDVSMVGMDGYETCQQLKQETTTQNIPVIFVSARGSFEDKTKAYEAGGYDYIIKPFNHLELETKIEHTIETVKELQTSSNQQDDILNITENSQLDETEIIVHFLFHCCTSPSLDELGKLLLKACQNLGLKCIFNLKPGALFNNIYSENEISPLEESLFEQTNNLESFFDFGSKTIITFPHVSLLIKNMPDSDSSRHEELKNLLGILLKGTESRIKSLINETALSQQYESIFEIIRNNLLRVEQHSELVRQKSIANIQAYANEIQEKYLDFELSKAQIEILKSISKDFMEQEMKIFSAEPSTEEVINTIKKNIKTLFD